MAQFPETPVTLLGRLACGDCPDQWNQSWKTFFSLYYPAMRICVVRAFMRYGWKSVPDHLVEDTLSDTFAALSKSQANFRYDPDQGRFRGYVAQIIHWKVKDRLKGMRREPHEGESALSREVSADTSAYESLAQQEERAWQYSALCLMLEEVSKQVSPQTYLIFEQTKLQERAPEEVMRELGVSRSTLDNANHRVMRKLISLASSPEFRRELLP